MKIQCATSPTFVRGHVLNVLNHGAVGDGVTLDHEAINNAIVNVANAGGGIVLVPPSRYIIGGIARPSDGPLSSISMLDNVVLHICAGAELIQEDTNPLISAVIVFKDGVKNAHVEGHGCIVGRASEGNSTGVGENHGIVFSDSENCSASQVTTKNHYGEGVLIGTGVGFGGTGLAVNARCFHMISKENARQGWAVVNAEEGGIFDCIAKDMLQVEDGGVSPGAGLDIEPPGTGFVVKDFKVDSFQSLRNRIGVTISVNPLSKSSGCSFSNIDINNCNVGFTMGFNIDNIYVENVNVKDSLFEGVQLIDAPLGKSKIKFGTISGNNRGIVSLPAQNGIAARTGWRISADYIGENKNQGILNQQSDFGVSYTRFGQNNTNSFGLADIQSDNSNGLYLNNNVHETSSRVYSFGPLQSGVERLNNIIKSSLITDSSSAPIIHEIISSSLVTNI